jgi:Putative DNA-binding domain
MGKDAQLAPRSPLEGEHVRAARERRGVSNESSCSTLLPIPPPQGGREEQAAWLETKPKLADTQREFARAVLDTAAGTPSPLVRKTGGTPAKRFGVYRNNVYASLVDVLAGRFPAVERLVGDAFFRSRRLAAKTRWSSGPSSMSRCAACRKGRVIHSRAEGRGNAWRGIVRCGRGGARVRSCGQPRGPHDQWRDRRGRLKVRQTLTRHYRRVRPLRLA